ncbi:MAG: metal ABC transporter permease [Deltaproteobacteria bacterium]|nr:metal ABC transporter permease [Deltaproteobacteria bacterium]
MPADIGFWASSFVWRDAMIVAVLSASALAYLGVWVVLKRAVYVPLALSQVSSAGVVLAFLIGAWLGVDEHDRHGLGMLFDPSWMSLLFALLTAFWFARPRGESSNAVVVAYLLGSAAVLVLGGFVRQDLHDVQSVLFGNAVLVDTIQILYVGVAALVAALVHALMHRRFLFVSFDPDAAGAAGLGPFRVEVALYATFALMISVATRAIGALPAFGLMVLPALTGLHLGRSMRAAFAISVASGVLAAGFGYYASFVLGLPTGASMVALAGLVHLGSLVARRA